MRSYLSYPEVIPSLISMLQSTKIDTDNVQLIMSMLRNIVEASLDADTQKEKVLILSQKVQTEDAIALGNKDEEESSDEEMSEVEQEVSADQQ